MEQREEQVCRPLSYITLLIFASSGMPLSRIRIISIVRGKKPGFSEKPGFSPFNPQVIERIPNTLTIVAQGYIGLSVL
jgi:hypothetical protein